MQLKGYEVWISCDGSALPEYQVRNEGDGKTVTCFVPSESGKTFAIEWRDRNKKTHLRLSTKIDGKEAGGNRCNPGGKGSRWGVRANPTTRLPFKFANLQTTDDDEVLGSPSHAHLGEIEVGVLRIRAEYRSVPHSWTKFQPVGAVHERSKKAGVHSVSLGEECRVATKRIQTNSTPLVHGEGDVAKFIFRYRPRALLQAQGIIDGDQDVAQPSGSKRRQHSEVEDASSVASSSRARTAKRSRPQDVEDVKPDLAAGDIDDLDSEEEDLDVLESKLAEIRRMQDKVERVIKRRKSEGGSKLAGPSQVSVKTEEGASVRSSSRRRSEPVVIDLTLNDSD
ncbi:hypothetical protein C8Q80DRAFT_362391 [Daedaleopsis nitida]|nr:hypothetical protein C8Q80DRAFT_362391 [Daedaleopsis nitida]